jgi:LysM repeat protein
MTDLPDTDFTQRFIFDENDARQTEEQGHVACFANVGSAVHRQHVGSRQQEVLHREHGFFHFTGVTHAGEKIVDLLTPGNANASEQLKDHVSKVGLGNPNVQTTVDGDKVTVTGEVATQEEKEKILLALGNIAGVASVDDQITVTGPAVEAATFVVVKKGDTLSAISLSVYGNANLYNKIFEANKPLLSHPDKIYPGQTLRIPK